MSVSVDSCAIWAMKAGNEVCLGESRFAEPWRAGAVSIAMGWFARNVETDAIPFVSGIKYRSREYFPGCSCKYVKGRMDFRTYIAVKSDAVLGCLSADV